MKHEEWLVCEDPLRMLKHLDPEGPHPDPAQRRPRPKPPSERKLWLWCVALYRLNPEPYRKVWWATGMFDTHMELDEPPEAYSVREQSVAWCNLDYDKPGDPPMPLRTQLLRDTVGDPFDPVSSLRVLCCCECKKSLEASYCRTCNIAPSMQDTFIRFSHWLTSDVLSLAKAAYEERSLLECGWCHGVGNWKDLKTGATGGCTYCVGRGVIEDGTLDPVRLSILADALEDAGCTDARITDHLRSPGPKYRGMWSLDLLLGKS